MSKKNEQPSVLAECKECGGQPKNHLILAEHSVKSEDEHQEITVWDVYQILECKGCNTVRFREYYTSTEDRDFKTGELTPIERDLYPDKKSLHPRNIEPSYLPPITSKMYSETLTCLNSGSNTLAAIGLRGTVESICNDQKIDGKSLAKKIDGLVGKGVLAKSQADYLHEDRIMGNEAAHEMRTPSKSELLDGLKIVEALMDNLYVLPAHAKRLKEERAKREKAKAK